MRGSIVRRKNNYSIKVSLGFDQASGKYRQHWEAVKGTKADAQKRLTEILHQLDTGSYMKPGKTTVADFLRKWLQDYVKPNLSPRGFDRYSGIIEKELIPGLGSILLTQLRPEHLQKHYTTRLNDGLNAGTVRYYHAVIHKALDTAMKWGLVNRNVADGVEIPRVHRQEMQVWDESEVNRFLEAAKDTPYYVLFYTALFTGMRRSELLGLRWQDIDLVFGQISVNRALHQLQNGGYVFTEPKSVKSRRTIALSPSLSLLLQDHKAKQTFEHRMLGAPLQETDLVFGNLDKPLRPNTITNAWRFLAIKAGVKVIRLHDARHTHASLMLKQGIHPKIVQERLGHSSIEMTLDIYSHVTPGLQEAAAQKFDALVAPKAISSKLVAR
jgi:integrase